MSTHASLHISHGGDTKSFMQYSDGYPTHVLGTLTRWVKTGGANKADGISHNGEALGLCHLTGYSRSLRENDTNKSLNLEPYYPHEAHTRGGDWSYYVDMDNNTITVFKNEEDVDVFNTAGPGVDPVIYVIEMKPDYQADEKAQIEGYMAELRDLGFTFIIAPTE